MDNLRQRLDDLIAPVPADETMPIDYSRRRWAVVRPAVIGAAAVGVVVIALLAAWLLRPAPTTMPEVQPIGEAAGEVADSGDSAVDAAGGDGEAAGGPAGTSEPEDGSAELVVSVVGLVHHPGVVVLPPGSRVADALAMAGGLLPEANFASVNHAAKVADGEQIVVTDQEMGPGVGAAAGGTGLVNLNSADASALESLPGVGPATARNIVTHRENNGPFAGVEQLLEVSGIGPAKFAQVKDLVTV